MSPTDWAHTATAERHRNAKAVTVAEHLRWHHHDAAHADAMSAAERAVILHNAGVRTSHPGELWALVVGLLRKWEAEHGA